MASWRLLRSAVGVIAQQRNSRCGKLSSTRPHILVGGLIVGSSVVSSLSMQDIHDAVEKEPFQKNVLRSSRRRLLPILSKLEILSG